MVWYSLNSATGGVRLGSFNDQKKALASLKKYTDEKRNFGPETFYLDKVSENNIFLSRRKIIVGKK